MAEQKKKTQNNYDLIAEQSKSRFLEWDQEGMIARHQLKADDEYLYIDFCSHPYRIHRPTATVECIDFDKPRSCNHDEIMSIYDFLCHESATLSGTWVTTTQLNHFVGVPSGNNNMFAAFEKFLDREDIFEKLSPLFTSLGYEPFGNCDVGCMFPVFADFPMVFQFWQSDEEFPPKINFLVDANTLDFLHNETIFYVILHWLEQFTDRLGGQIRIVE